MVVYFTDQIVFTVGISYLSYFLSSPPYVINFSVTLTRKIRDRIRWCNKMAYKLVADDFPQVKEGFPGMIQSPDAASLVYQGQI